MQIDLESRAIPTYEGYAMDVNSVFEQTQLAERTHAYSGKRLAQYPQLVEHLLAVKRACAWANYQLGIISVEHFTEIDKACQAVIEHQEWFTADLAQGGGGVAVHMNLSEAICQQLGNRNMLAKVNSSQSTTDVCTTALSLSLSLQIQQCRITLLPLVETLKKLGQATLSVVTRGRTCLRDAGLLPYGARFLGFARLFERNCVSLESHADFAYSNLGATAIGTGEGIAANLRGDYSSLALEQLIKITGMKIRLHPDLMDSVQNRDDLFAVANCLESLTVNLLKMAKDLRLLASGPQFGFNEIQLPQLIKGSSFYANKINPTLDETLIQLCFTVLGLVKSAKLGIEHAELDMNIYYFHSTVCLLDAFQLVNALLPKYVQYHLSQLTLNQRENYEPIA